MILAEFHFLRPLWLLVTIPLTYLLWLLWQRTMQQGNWAKYCDERLLPYILQNRSSQKNRSSWLLVAVVGIVSIIALAGPVWDRLPVPVFKNTFGRVILLDLSKSMDAADLKPSRLVRARYKISDVLNAKLDGQTALVVYSGDAFVVSPLTDDVATIINMLPALTTDIMPKDGNNGAAAIGKAVELFKQAGVRKGSILLVTDGVDYKKAQDEVKKISPYKLSVLAIGTSQGAPINLPGGGFLKDSQGSIVVPRLNTGDLRDLSKQGRGVMHALTGDNKDINALLPLLDQASVANTIERDDLLMDQWRELGPWLVILIIPVVALAFRKGVLFVILLLLAGQPKESWAFDWNHLWQNQDQKAQEAYGKQNYQQAAQVFKNPAWRAAAAYKSGQYEQAVKDLEGLEDNSSVYNKGNALAQLGRLEDSLAAYEKVLESEPNHEDAIYNKALVEEALKKQQEKQEKESSQNNSSDDSKNSEEKQAADEQQQKNQNNSEKPEDKEQKKSDEQQANPGNQQDSGQRSDSDTNKEPNKQQDETDNQQSTDEAEENELEKQQAQKESEKDAVPPAETAAEEEKMSAARQNKVDEQWLKRIPDDPGGLLKRKFEYQYRRQMRR